MLIKLKIILQNNLIYIYTEAEDDMQSVTFDQIKEQEEQQKQKIQKNVGSLAEKVIQPHITGIYADQFGDTVMQSSAAAADSMYGEDDPMNTSAQSSYEKQREESIEKRKKEHSTGATHARNRSESPYKAYPRSTSEERKIRTINDLKQDETTRGRSRSRTIHEHYIDFADIK